MKSYMKCLRYPVIFAATLTIMIGCDSAPVEEAPVEETPSTTPNLQPTSYGQRLPIGAVVTVNDQPLPAIGPIGVVVRDDGRYVATGMPGAPCMLWIYEMSGALIEQKTITELVSCSNGIVFAEGILFVGVDDKSIRQAVLTDLNGNVVRTFPDFPELPQRRYWNVISSPTRLFFPVHKKGIPSLADGLVISPDEHVLVKYSSRFLEEWQLNLGIDFWVEHVLQKSDGGYLVAGRRAEDRSRRYDEHRAVVGSINAHGEVEWTKTFGAHTRVVDQIAPIDDTTYLLVGNAVLKGQGVGWFSVVDDTGDIEWSSDKLWDEQPLLADKILWVEHNLKGGFDMLIVHNAAKNHPIIFYSIDQDGTKQRIYRWPLPFEYANFSSRSCKVHSLTINNDGNLLGAHHCISDDWTEIHLSASDDDRYRGDIWSEIIELR